MTVREIPTRSGRPFSEIVTWQGVAYTLRFKWLPSSLCWVLDIYDFDGTTPILTGLALVTGCDVLEQFGYLAVAQNTAMTVITLGPGIPPDDVPTFDNLGSDGHVFLVMP